MSAALESETDVQLLAHHLEELAWVRWQTDEVDEARALLAVAETPATATPKNMPHTIRLSGAAIAIVCRLSRDTPKSVAAEAPRRATVCARVSSRAQAHQSPP